MQGGFLLGGTVAPGIGGFLTDVSPWLPFVAQNSSNQERLAEARGCFANRAFVVALVAPHVTPHVTPTVTPAG